MDRPERRRQSPRPAPGPTRVYLSTDATWDISDLLIGQVAFSGTVAAGRVRTPPRSTPTCRPPRPAQYRIIVRTDIFDDVVESNELNNTTASADVVTVTVPALHLGVPLQTTLSTGQDQLYEVQVGLGQTLRVDLTSSDAAASNELFLRYNAVPTGSQYDAIYQGALQANQFAVIPSTQAGDIPVLVRGQSEPAANTPVTLRGQRPARSRSPTSSPTRGATATTSPPRSWARQFDPQAIVKLVRPGLRRVRAGQLPGGQQHRDHRRSST